MRKQKAKHNNNNNSKQQILKTYIHIHTKYMINLMFKPVHSDSKKS